MGNSQHLDNKTSQNLDRHNFIKGESKALLVVLLLSCGLFLSILANLVLLTNNRALAKREKIYVQTPDGFTVEAKEFEALHRESEIIKRTISVWIQLTFEWDNDIPDSDLKDEGIELYGTTVPTKAYLGSILMADGFRREFLKTLGNQVIPRSVYSGRLKSFVRFYSISNPRLINEGRWEVDVVSTRFELLDGIEQKEVNFNRTFTVQAILPVEPAFDNEPDPFKRKAYELLNNGLIITDIKPLDLSGNR